MRGFFIQAQASDSRSTMLLAFQAVGNLDPRTATTQIVNQKRLDKPKRVATSGCDAPGHITKRTPPIAAKDKITAERGLRKQNAADAPNPIIVNKENE